MSFHFISNASFRLRGKLLGPKRRKTSSFRGHVLPLDGAVARPICELEDREAPFHLTWKT